LTSPVKGVRGIPFGRSANLVRLIGQPPFGGEPALARAATESGFRQAPTRNKETFVADAPNGSAITPATRIKRCNAD